MQFRLVKKHFEKSMDKYNDNAVVQLELAQKLSSKLASICPHFNNVLELGCGTGLLTQELKKKISFNNYWANDIVEKAKNYIQNILPEHKFIHGNAAKINLPQNLDLIVSNAMFQWFFDITKLTDHFKKSLKKDSILAFSTFGEENFCEIKNITGLSLNYLKLEDITSKLSSDFEILYTEEYKKIIEFSSPLEILSHMKNTGVNSLSPKGWSYLEVKEFCEKYLKMYNTPQLTYNPIIIIAKRK